VYPNKIEQNWVPIHESGSQFKRFAGSCFRARVDLMKKLGMAPLALAEAFEPNQEFFS
jgi:hypothetical protein